MKLALSEHSTHIQRNVEHSKREIVFRYLNCVDNKEDAAHKKV
jgi:hypothetical protein